MDSGCIARYFPGMDPHAAGRFERLAVLYEYWNAKINVISRKDLSNLYLNHVLHSLSLAKVITFSREETVLDIGTGGGFPGIPLAIMYPDVQFTLIDSVGKKIKVVESIKNELGLQNILAVHTRAENIHGLFHYVISRAVCSFPKLIELSAGKLLKDPSPAGHHGIYSLKGGDLRDDLADWQGRVHIYEISGFFEEDFFRTKSIVYLPSGEIKVK